MANIEDPVNLTGISNIVNPTYTSHNIDLNKLEKSFIGSSGVKVIPEFDPVDEFRSVIQDMSNHTGIVLGDPNEFDKNANHNKVIESRESKTLSNRFGRNSRQSVGSDIVSVKSNENKISRHHRTMDSTNHRSNHRSNHRFGKEKESESDSGSRRSVSRSSRSISGSESGSYISGEEGSDNGSSYSGSYSESEQSQQSQGNHRIHSRQSQGNHRSHSRQSQGNHRSHSRQSEQSQGNHRSHSRQSEQSQGNHRSHSRQSHHSYEHNGNNLGHQINGNNYNGMQERQIDNAINNYTTRNQPNPESERDEDFRASLLEDIDDLKFELEQDGIDISKIPEVNKNSRIDDIKNVHKMLRLKYDKKRCNSFGSELILAGIQGLEWLFDGKKKWGPYTPDLTGWHNTVKPKLRRMRYETSTVISGVMQEYNIGPMARIGLELVPSAFIYSNMKKEQYGQANYTPDQMSEAFDDLRQFE